MDHRTQHQVAVDSLLDQLIVAKGALAQAESMNRVYENTLIKVAGRSCMHDTLFENLRGLHMPLAGADVEPLCIECAQPAPCRTMRLLIPS